LMRYLPAIFVRNFHGGGAKKKQFAECLLGSPMGFRQKPRQSCDPRRSHFGNQVSKRSPFPIMRIL
jgi:hypothetical protein